MFFVFAVTDMLMKDHQTSSKPSNETLRLMRISSSPFFSTSSSELCCCWCVQLKGFQTRCSHRWCVSVPQLEEQLSRLQREKNDLQSRMEEDQEDLNELMKKHKAAVAQVWI